MSKETETEAQTPEQIEDEQVEQPEEEHEEHHPAKQSSGATGTFIAILLALGAIGASYYLWQQQQVAKANAKALQGQVSKLLGVIEQNQKDVLERMKTVPPHQHPEINQRLDKMQASLFELRSHVGQERRGWQVSEVEYLLRIAEDRLQLERDADTAITALQTAKQRLQSLNSQTFAPVIKLIDSDIARLSAINLPDRDKLAAKITAVTSSIDTLPLLATASVPSTQSGNKDKTPTKEETKGPIWQKLWHDILGLVTIRHNDKATRPLLVPKERYFLRQNLQLKLQSARLALLSGNDATWKASLSEAGDWLRTYFDTDADSVHSALDTLTTLAAVELNPQLPELSNTRKLLQRTAMQMPASQPSAPAPKAAPVTPAAKTPPAEPTKAPSGETSAGITKPDASEVKTTPSKTPAADSADKTPATSAPDSATPTDVPQLPQGAGQ